MVVSLKTGAVPPPTPLGVKAMATALAVPLFVAVSSRRDSTRSIPYSCDLGSAFDTVPQFGAHVLP